jgi:DNA invertase Pin-like site-specific DNA recombinase
MKRVAVYTRVSTDAQTTENQQRELAKVSKQRGWKMVKVYTDHGISGTKGRDQRPAFDSLIKDATCRKFDIIAAWSVDRRGRSLKDLLGFLTEIHALEVGLYLHQQAVDTTTPAGRALFQMIADDGRVRRVRASDDTRACDVGAEASEGEPRSAWPAQGRRENRGAGEG